MPTSIVSDLASIAIASARRAIQGRSIPIDIFGRTPTPSYESLRKREEALLKGSGEAISPLAPRADPRTGGPFNSNEAKEGAQYTQPSNRIDRNLIIYDLETGDKIILPFVPQTLDYNPESSFVAIPSMARNNPLYHYTGSEDTLEFTIDWFAQKENREDVILNCKRVESLSKNDSFNKPPHLVMLIWGDSIFSDAEWLVVAAPYKLTNFQAHRGMLPQQAIQSVTLKRVTKLNSSLAQIQSLNF